jgi:hypothetical protein
MKKTIFILSAILLLSSCSKEEIKQQGQVNYNLSGYTHQNTTLKGIKYSEANKYIQYSFKINDSITGSFVLSTEKDIQYCHSNIVTEHSNGTVTEKIVDYKMIGRYYLVDKVVNGVFTGSGINYIDFTNYQL